MKTRTRSEQNSLNARWGSLKRQMETRYVITFNIRGVKPNANGKWPKAVWPILFPTYELAHKAVELLPVFYRPPPAKGKFHRTKNPIKSVCIESRRVRRAK